MTAHRLISTLLLLQRRGTVTAAEVADETEVSPRTARRDLEALATAGVPVYSRAGRGGGWSLVGGARTDLSGLRADEAQALFLVAGPAASVSPDLRSALRKLVEALPEPMRNDAEAAADAVVIDAKQWGGVERPPPEHLAAVQAAVLAGRRITIGYRDRAGRTTHRHVDPWGTVDKQRMWYLVAGTAAGRRTFRIDRITSIDVMDEPAKRPTDFDLDAAWQQATAAYEATWAGVRADLLIEAHAVHLVEGFVGASLAVGAGIDDGRVRATLTAINPEAAAAQIAGFADMVEVLGPPPVVRRLARLGRLLADGYGSDADRPDPP